MRLIKDLLQDSENDYQIKFFKYIILVVTIAVVAASIANLFYISHIEIVISNFVLSLIFLVFMYLSWVKNKHKVVIPLSILSIYLLLGAQFFLTEGIGGFSVVYFALLIPVPLMVLKKSLHRTYGILVTIYILSLLSSHWLFPELFAKYESENSKNIDRAVSVVIVSILAPAIFIYFKNIIEKQKQQLADKNKELEQLNQQLESFAHTAAHDLKSPIIAALNMIQLSKMTDDINEIKEYIELEESSLTKLNNFISELLELAKSNQKEIELTPVNVKDVYFAIANDLQYIDKAFQFKFNYKDATPIIHTDKLKLEVIISNMVSNSIKYRDLSKPENFMELTLSSGENYILTFKDNGIGIEEDKLSKIFEAFYRGTNQAGSSGIGLHTVKEAVKSLGGDINVASESGTGTTFTIYLPKKQG